MYDYIIVGSGLYGLLIAYKLNLFKKKILLVDKKNSKKFFKNDFMIITKKSYNLLQDLLNVEIDNFIYKKYNNFIFNNKKVNKIYYILDLKKLKKYIFDNIKNINLKFNVKIEKYLYKQNKLVIDNKEYYYKDLIASDGTLSEIRMNNTGKIQKFLVDVSLKSKKNNKENVINYSKYDKHFEQMFTVRNNSYLRIINKKRKNDIFNNINEIKNKYEFESNKINVNLIPNGDIYLNKNNIYFIGDSSGLIDPFNHLTMEYNLIIINMFPNFDKKKIKKIKKDILKKKMISKFLYLPIIDKLIIKLVNSRKEDLW